MSSRNKPEPPGGTRRLKSLAVVALGCVCLSLPACAWYARSAPRPDTLGIQDARLFPCPSSPNCVSSFEEGDHAIEPLPFRDSVIDAMQALERTITGMNGTTIVTRDERYLHAEFRTPWLGFIDDIEFLVDTTRGVIHVRSASRRGYSDLGTNRARVEAIRAAFEEESAGSGARP